MSVALKIISMIWLFGEIPYCCLQSDPVPSDTVPSDTVPSDTVPSDTVPSDTVPSDTVPSDTVPSDTVPSDTVPSDTVPSDTVPSLAFERLAGLFYGREFRLSQVSKKNSPVEGETIDKAEMHIRSCSDAVVIRSHRVAAASSKRKAAGHADNEVDSEYRWLRGKTLWETRVYSSRPIDWPVEPSEFPKPPTLKVIQNDVNDHVAWGPGTMIISDLACSVDHAQLTFAEMCSDQGTRGFRQEGAISLSDDGQEASCSYVSPDFGRVEATIRRYGEDWLPIRACILRTADDKVVPDGIFPFLGSNNRLKNYRTFSEFTKKNARLDSSEIEFLLSYESSGGSIFPKTIVRNDLMRSGTETYSIQTSLSVNHVEPKEISCDSVLDFALEIPDGTAAVVARSETPNIAWTVMNGELVKQINRDTLVDGSSTLFSSGVLSPKAIAVNAVMIVLAAFTWTTYSKRKGGVA